MIPVNLILTIVGLLFVLILLVSLYVWGNKRKAVSVAPENIETFESLSAIINNRSSGSAALTHAVEMILSRFGTITPHSVGSYKHLVQSLCVHPRTDSKLILRFEKTLRVNNPSFSHEIEKALAAGLAARG